MTLNDFLSYAERFARLYKSKQEMMRTEIQAILDDLEETDHSDPDWYGKWQERLPEIQGWHQVCGLVSGWSCIQPDRVSQDVWLDALAILAKYETSKIVEGKLIPDV